MGFQPSEGLAARERAFSSAVPQGIGQELAQTVSPSSFFPALLLFRVELGGAVEGGGRLGEYGKSGDCLRAVDQLGFV